MIATCSQSTTYNTFPRDVTSPGPYQRPGVAASQVLPKQDEVKPAISIPGKKGKEGKKGKIVSDNK